MGGAEFQQQFQQMNAMAPMAMNMGQQFIGAQTGVTNFRVLSANYIEICRVAAVRSLYMNKAYIF